jgi:hypothetical protein
LKREKAAQAAEARKQDMLKEKADREAAEAEKKKKEDEEAAARQQAALSTQAGKANAKCLHRMFCRTICLTML